MRLLPSAVSFGQHNLCNAAEFCDDAAVDACRKCNAVEFGADAAVDACRKCNAAEFGADAAVDACRKCNAVEFGADAAVDACRKCNAVEFCADAADQCQQVLLSAGDGCWCHRVEQFAGSRISALRRVTRR